MTILDKHNREEWRLAAFRSGWRAKRLATELEISRRQLQRYTRAVFQRSPQDWLDEQRLIYAGEKLMELRSAKQVAYELGYKQPSHFSRQFKRFHGLPPTRFLRLERPEDAGRQMIPGHGR